MERWKINLYTLWVTQVFSLMGFGMATPFIPYYLQKLGMTDPTQLNLYVGLAATIPAATMAVAAPIWGMVSDRYGRKMMLMRAMVAAAILLVMMGLVSSVGQFMVLRAIQGIFTGTITASMAFVSANTPEKRMSFALGFLTSSNFIGYSVGPFVGGILAEMIGYRLCFMIGGVLMTIGFVLVLMLVKEDKSSYGKRLPSDLGEKKAKPKLFTPFILMVLVTIFVARMGRTIFVPFVPLYVQDSLGTAAGAATYTGLINGATGLATAVSALTITRLGDRKDKFRLIFLLGMISIPLSILLVPFRSIFVFTIAFTAYFFIAGAIEPILTSAASENTSSSMRGALFGMLGMVNNIAMMIAPMAGAYVSVQFGVRAILILIPIFTLIQGVLLFMNRKKTQELRALEEASEYGG